MKFIADDGKIFDTMEECEDYETKNSTISLALYWNDNITMLNKNGEVVEPKVMPMEHNYLNHLASFLDSDTVWYLIIPEKCDNDVQWKKFCDFIDNEYSINIPISSGIWRWDEDTYEWHNFVNEYKKFTDQWTPIGRYLHMNAL